MGEKISKKINKITDKFVEHTWVVRAVRFGYVVRGSVYVLAGIFGMQLALGLRANGANLTQIVMAVGQQGSGKFFLAVTTFGLAVYSLWGFLRGGANVSNCKNDLSGWITRLGFLISGVSYGSLALAAGTLFEGIQVSANSSDPSAFSAKVLTVPFGQPILIFIGICFLVGAIFQILIAFKEKFKKDLNISELRTKKEHWPTFLAKAGIISRSIVLGIGGGFVIKAAVSFNSSQAMGIGQTLGFLRSLVFGEWIVATISVGLVMFGAFSIISATYLKLPQE